MAEPPAGSVPFSFDSKFVVDNEALTKAEYILTDKISGVETVAIAPDGQLGLVDKLGRVSKRSRIQLSITQCSNATSTVQSPQQ